MTIDSALLTELGGYSTLFVLNGLKRLGLAPAVTSVSTGKERIFNRRFLETADRYMVEPTACSPASG